MWVYIGFCSRLSQVELSWVLLQIALAFCYVNLFSLFRLFFSYVWSRHERHLKVAEIRNLRPTCVMFTIWGTSIWYTIHIYLVIYVVYPIPNAGPEAATVLGGTRRYLPMRPWEAYVILVVSVVLGRSKCDASFRANRWQMVFWMRRVNERMNECHLIVTKGEIISVSEPNSKGLT